MRIIDSLSIKNYANIKTGKFSGLKDVNIIIGPNNCGKSNILRLFSKLNNFDKTNPNCEFCQNNSNDKYSSLEFKIGDEYSYMGQNTENTEIGIKFSDKVPVESEAERKRISQHMTGRTLLFEGNNRIQTDCMSKLSAPKSLSYINNLEILYIGEKRLRSKVTKNFANIVQNRNFRLDDFNELRDWLRTVDPYFEGQTAGYGLARDISNFPDSSQDIFEDEMENQGSGLKSVSTIAIEIISNNPDLIVIDEPEIGLNPKSKYRFIDTLFEYEGQVIMATHDPTFVNPTLWAHDSVALFVYSEFKNKFIKINLDQAKDTPETFGGFLPHTTSKKKSHLYVEGSNDVAVFQGALMNYLQENRTGSWNDIFNQIGIYHLGGENWKHLLDTILIEKPNILVLDGDMNEDVNELLKYYKDSKNIDIIPIDNQSSPEEISGDMDKNQLPILCLSKEDINDYFDLDNGSESASEKALKMEYDNLPEEIRLIIESILSTSGHI